MPIDVRPAPAGLNVFPLPSMDDIRNGRGANPKLLRQQLELHPTRSHQPQLDYLPLRQHRTPIAFPYGKILLLGTWKIYPVLVSALGQGIQDVFMIRA
jgi:hypothetical protein